MTSMQEIVRDYFVSVYRLALILLLNKKAAEEATFDVFKILPSVKVKVDKASVFKYTYDVALQLTQYSRPQQIDTLEMKYQGIKDDLIDLELIEILKNNIEKLTTTEKFALTVNYIESLTITELELVQDQMNFNIADELKKAVDKIISELKKNSRFSQMNPSDVAINISKISKFNFYIPRVEFSTELSQRLANEDIQPTVELNTTEVVTKVAPEVRKPSNLPKLLKIILLLLVAAGIFAAVFYIMLQVL